MKDRLRKESKGEGASKRRDAYVLDENDLLWYTSPKKPAKLAIPRSLMPGLLAWVHTTHGHAGVMRTTAGVNARYEWPDLFVDIRKYLLSCGCRRRKRTNSHTLAMRPDRFLRAWEVLEMDISDMKQVSASGNRYLLIIVDRATKFPFASPLAAKIAVPVAKCLLKLFLTFGVPYFSRSDAGGEFTSEVVNHVCQWVKVKLDHGPAEHPRGQGRVERYGGWLHDVLAELCKQWPKRWDEYVYPAVWIHRTTPDPSLPNNPTPFKLLFGREPRTQID
ncbi:unnamed protein product, partial [Sphacelaria rigidula]